MSYKLVKRALETGTAPTDRLVLIVLAEKANDAGWDCWPSVATIVRLSGLGERTVRRSLLTLEQGGHLTRVMRSGTSTQYHVHPCQSGTPTPATAAPLPCHSDTPATAAPLPMTPDTPAAVAPKPPRTIIRDDADASSARGEDRPPLSAFALAPANDDAAADRNEVKPKKPKAAKPKPAPIDVPEWMPVTPWDGYLAMRKRKGADPSPRAIELLIGKLDRWRTEGSDLGAILDQSTLNNWTDLYPLKAPNRSNHNDRQSARDDDAPRNPIVRAAIRQTSGSAAGQGDADRWP